MADPAAPGLLASIRSTVPTREGRRLVWAASLLLAAALATQRPSLYAGASLLLALYAVGHLGAALAARSLEVSWDCPARVHAAESFPLRLLLRNRGPLALTGVEVHGPARGPAPPAAVSGTIPAGGSLPLEVRARVRRRGLHRLEAPVVAVRWPLLLAVSLRPPGEAREVLAWPRRIPVPRRALRAPAPEPVRREAAAASLHGGTLFRGVRDWAPGDAPRAIAWRASARHGRLLSREFDREEAGRAVVLLDADARDLPAAFRTAAVERACSLAASLLLRLRAEGRRTTFAAFTPEPLLLRSLSTGDAMARAMEALALLEPPRRPAPPRDPLALVPAALLRGARVLLVSAATGPPRSRRGPGGSEVVVLPALRATFAPGGTA